MTGAPSMMLIQQEIKKVSEMIASNQIASGSVGCARLSRANNRLEHANLIVVFIGTSRHNCLQHRSICWLVELGKCLASSGPDWRWSARHLWSTSGGCYFVGLFTGWTASPSHSGGVWWLECEAVHIAQLPASRTIWKYVQCVMFQTKNVCAWKIYVGKICSSVRNGNRCTIRFIAQKYPHFDLSNLELAFPQHPIYVTISDLSVFISFVQPPSSTWSSPIWQPKRRTHCSTRMPANTRRSATTGTIHISNRCTTISAHFCHTLIMKLRPWIPADFGTISCKRMKWFWSEDRTTASSHHGNRGNAQKCHLIVSHENEYQFDNIYDFLTFL